MKERPILFSGPMVRAILDGKKTQTRRVFKVRDPFGKLAGPICPPEEVVRFDDGTFHYLSTGGMSGPWPCPYGQPGDRLWVRETWGESILDIGDVRQDRWYTYRADHCVVPSDNGSPLPWRPSIHMPRCASRITLEIADVRVERLQEISDIDVIYEGLDSVRAFNGHVTYRLEDQICGQTPQRAYRLLWDSLNEKRGYGWDTNPWLWVLSFRRLPCPT